MMTKTTVEQAVKVITIVKNFPAYFADNFLNRKKCIVLRLWNGGAFQIRPRTLDRGIFREIWIQEVYTPKGFKPVEEDLVVDVGAHIGIFSILASRLARKGRVYAFEPVSENFELLKRNIEINNAKNIIAIDQAVSGQKGQKEIFISRHSTGGHSIFLDFVSPGGTAKMEKVDSISLYEFMIRYDIEKIDFLKMDCEGAEYDILFDCPDEIFKMITKISMEYHDLDGIRNSTLLRKFLETKGYRTMTKPDTRILYAKQN